MLKLIMRDRAVRLLGPWLLLGVLIGFILASNQQDAVRHGLTVGRHGFQGFRTIAYLPWGILALHLLYAGVTIRCDRFDVTLPIPQRTLWLSRVLALTLSQWVLIGTAVTTLLLRNQLEGFQVVGRTRVESLFAQLAAASILAVVLARLPRPSLIKLPYEPMYMLYLILVWAGTLGVVFEFAGEPPIYAAVPLAAALALGLWVYRSLPESFVLVPREPEGQELPPASPRTRIENGARETVTSKEISSRWLLHTTIWRTCYGHWVSWLGFSLLLALGYGAARSEPTNDLSGFWLFILYWIVLGVLLGGTVSRLHMLDPLPISRKLIFVYVTLPGLLIASLGYVGFRVIGTVPSHQLLVDCGQHPVVRDLDIHVPPEFWEISWDADPPPVEEPYVAPWEEAYYAWSVSLIKGLPIVLYSPYHVPDGSSPEFVAEQLSRAVEAVYGAHIPAEEIQRRYLLTKADGSAGVRPGGLTLREDYAGLKPIKWLQTMPMTILLIGLPWLLYLALVVRGGLVSPVTSRKPWGYLVPIGLSALYAFVSLWSYSAGYTKEWKISAFTAILVRQLSELLPGSTIVQCGIVCLLLASAYLWAQARFERIEMPVAVSSGFEPI